MLRDTTEVKSADNYHSSYLREVLTTAISGAKLPGGAAHTGSRRSCQGPLDRAVGGFGLSAVGSHFCFSEEQCEVEQSSDSFRSTGRGITTSCTTDKKLQLPL